MYKDIFDSKKEKLKNKIIERLDNENNREVLNKNLRTILNDMENMDYYFMHVSPRNVIGLLLFLEYSEDEITEFVHQIYSKENIAEFKEYEKKRKINLLKKLIPKRFTREKNNKENKDRDDNEIEER